MPMILLGSELQAGMRVAEEVRQQGKLLLPAGTLLTAGYANIFRIHYPHLHVSIGDPILDAHLNFEDDGHDREVATTVQRKIAVSMERVRELYSSRASLAGMDFQEINTAVRDVMDYLDANPVASALLRNTMQSDDYLSEHAGNVFYLSMVLGSAVRMYIEIERRRASITPELKIDHVMDLTPLGLGAMMMDIGMLPLLHLYNSDEPLDEMDRQAIHDHPCVGADMLPKSFSPLAKMVVRTHHENFDGTGYPLKLHGKKTHVFSRVARICDAYDAATADLAYSTAKHPAIVIWEMLYSECSSHYDPVLLKVFSRLIQPFPIGSRVTLNDGRQAVVIRYNRHNPFYPQVVVAFDAQGKRIPSERLENPIHLDTQTNLHIVASGDDDLRCIYDGKQPSYYADYHAPDQRDYARCSGQI